MAKTVIQNTDSPKDSRAPINNMFTELYEMTNVHDATSKATPVDADELGLWDSVAATIKKLTWANLKATLKIYFDTLYNTKDGWISLGTCTYEGADAPTFTFSLAYDVTGVLAVGQRIKLTQTTVKYFIITGVGTYSAGKTIITVYGGTDYTLANAAITSPFYSIMKAPFGFPLDPIKWTVTLTDTSERAQSSPSVGTWYNPGGLNISVPIGAWRVEYYMMLYILRNSAGHLDVKFTLSTANNSESDSELTSNVRLTLNLASQYNFLITRAKSLLLASKTAYYLNINEVEFSVDTIAIAGNRYKTVVKAVCSYL